MENKNLSVDMQIAGDILSMPTILHMGEINGSFVVQGEADAKKMNLTGLVRMADEDIAEQYGSCFKKLTGSLPEKLFFRHSNGSNLIWFRSADQQVGVQWQNGSVAVLVVINMNDHPEAGSMEYYITTVASGLGIQKLYLIARKGSDCSLPLLAKAVLGESDLNELPAVISKSSLFLYGKFVFEESNAIGKIIDFLFGMKDVNLQTYLVIGEKDFMSYVMLPGITGNLMQAKDIYVGIGMKNGSLSFALIGTFLFSFLPDVIFHVAGGFNTTAFVMEAFARIAEPIPLIGNLKMGDTCLSIGFSAGKFMFQMFCNLRLGNGLNIFGAVGLNVTGTLTTVNLVSAAITNLALPVFIHSLLGEDVTFADSFDFIAIEGFSLDAQDDFAITKDTAPAEAVQIFNSKIKDANFTLDAENVQLSSFGEGTILIDKKRMRHYYINKMHKLSLQAQFYYAMEEVELGDYKITPGIFLCCTIDLFHKLRIRALFSISPESGILAYASLSKIDLGIITIEASGIPGENPFRNIPQNSLLRELMDKEENGVVFYLHAAKDMAAFCIDGKVSIFGLFGIAARVIYLDKNIQLDIRFDLAPGVTAALHLKALYSDFSNAKAEIAILVDCTGLQDKLVSVKNTLENAIAKLKQKMDSAQQQITQAQNHVNELQNNINSLNNQINGCKDAVRQAPWYSAPFVAVAKGVEIAALEVAIGAVYAAMGIANAALELAKQVVNIAGIVGENVLNLVKGAVDVTLNLFFVNYIKLVTVASLHGNYFDAEIEFVALGKRYHFTKQIGAAEAGSSVMDAIGAGMTDTMSGDLAHIEDGSFKAPVKSVRMVMLTAEQNFENLDNGIKQISSGTGLLSDMTEAVLQSCGRIMPESDLYTVEYMKAMDHVSLVLEVANSAADYDAMNRMVDLVQQKLEAKNDLTDSEDAVRTKTAISHYQNMLGVLAQVSGAMDVVEQNKQDFMASMQEIKKREANGEFSTSKEIAGGGMGDALNQTEELLYKYFPPEEIRGKGINLSRESKIIDSFDTAREKLGVRATGNVMMARSANALTEYDERL